MRLLLSLLAAALAFSQDRFYRFSVDQDALSGAPDFSFLNRPLTPADRIVARGGHFHTLGADRKANTADDRRVRLFGVNLAFGGNFPEAADAVRIARRLRKLGVNLVRLHHMDTSPDKDPATARSILTQGPYPTLNPVSVERLRRFLDALKNEGIYCNVNLHVGYVFRPEVDGVPPMPEGKPMPTHTKPLHIFHPRMVELQTVFAERVLSALKLKNDPVLAMVEIDNETALIDGWQKGHFETLVLGEYRAELERQWMAYQMKKNPGGRLERALVGFKDSGPESRINEFLHFLVDRDREYLRRMREAVHRATDPLVPVAGTQMNFGGLLTLDSHDVLDYQDSHFYIDHYNFPNRRWDSRDWRIRNSSAVGSGLASYVNLAFSRLAGQPYTVSEYNNAFPNTHGAEIDPTLAVFGAFQDWDSVMHFAYQHSQSWDLPTPSGFNLASDWNKLPGFGQSAWLFRSGAIRAGKPVDVPMPIELRLRAGRERVNGRIAPFLEKALGIDPLSAISHAVRLAKDSSAAAPAALKAGNTGARRSQDFSYDPGLRLFTVHAAKAAGVFGFARKAQAGPLGVELDPATREFAAVLLTALDDRPLAESRHMLLTAPGAVLRSCESDPPRPLKLVNYPGTTDWWTLERDKGYEDRPSGTNGPGAGPSWMERVECRVSIAVKAKALSVYPLDGAGRRLEALGAAHTVRGEGGFQIHLQADGQALSPWYEIVAR